MQAILSIVGVLGFGSIVAGLISWRIAILNHEQARINALRDDVTTFFRDLEVMHYTIGDLFAAKTDAGTLEKRTQDARVAILFTYWRIVLRLNATQRMHIDLREKLDDLMVVREKVPDRTTLHHAADLAQQILHREWDITKHGLFTRPALWGKAPLAASTTVNLRLGLLRLWAVASALWAALWIWHYAAALWLWRYYPNVWLGESANPDPVCREGLPGGSGGLRVIPTECLGLDLLIVTEPIRTVLSMVLAIAGPPLAVLLAGMVARWVFLGFRRSR